MEDTTPIGNKSFEEKVTESACKMLEDGLTARRARFAEIKKNEDMYFGVMPKRLKGRHNVPFSSMIMRGFIDSAVANSVQDIGLSYGRTREQDKLSADKISSAWAREMGPDKANWLQVLTDGKYMAGLAGRGFAKLVVNSVPNFNTALYVPDHYDMVTEPQGGGDLDRHLFKFEQNIFRSRTELLDGASDGFYDKTYVRKLINAYRDGELRKKSADRYAEKQTRLVSAGMNGTINDYVGQTLYPLAEGVVNFEGKWYYIFFDPLSKIHVRLQPLAEVFEYAKDYPGRGPWVSWATHPHPMVFWTPSSADDVRPIAYAMKESVDYTLDNLEKRNWDMKAYDPKIFTDPTKLLYRQDGIVKATLKNGAKIRDGVFQFETPDTASITINFTEWLNNFVGRETGVTAEAKGQAQTDRVGILMSNMEQVSRRMNIKNDRFKSALVNLGVMFDYSMYQHLREPYAVKIIGPKGARWSEDITRRDTERTFSVTVRAREDEERKNVADIQRKEAGFKEIAVDQELRMMINKQWRATERLRAMGYEDEDIKVALDTQNDGDDMSRMKAAQAIQDCLDGKELYTLYRDATPAFIKRILDFLDESFELIPPQILNKMAPSEKRAYKKKMQTYDKLAGYARAHMEIVQKNMVRRAVSVISQEASAAAANGAPAPVAPRAPGPVTPSVV